MMMVRSQSNKEIRKHSLKNKPNGKWETNIFELSFEGEQDYAYDDDGDSDDDDSNRGRYKR